MSSVDSLIDRSETAAAANAAWLGSGEHLQMLTEAVPDLGAGDDIAVRWVPAGMPGYWEAANRVIAVERPTAGAAPTTPEQRAEFTALGLLHETTHARFSSPSSMPRRLPTLRPEIVRGLSEAMFNYLEDARISACAIAEEPELAEPIDKHLCAALDAIAEYPIFAGPGRQPRDPRRQLPYALIAYALQPNCVVELHPAVAAELERLKPIIDAARHAERTDACVEPAIELIQQVVHFQP